MKTTNDKEVMIDENDYSEEEEEEEEGEEGEEGDQTSQEVAKLPIDSLVSKEKMTSSSTSSAVNEEIALFSANQLPTNGYYGEQLNQMYWWPLYQQQTNDNNGSQFQPPMTTTPTTGNLQMAPQPTGCVQMPSHAPISSQMPPYMMHNYYLAMSGRGGAGSVGWPQNYWPMAGPSTSVSGDNCGQPSTSLSAKTGDDTKPSKTKLYSCRLCSHMNYIKDVVHFRLHIEQHLGSKRPFKCDICDKPFAYKSICRNHVMAHCVVRPNSSPTTSSGGQQ